MKYQRMNNGNYLLIKKMDKKRKLITDFTWQLKFALI